jgi:hypothetical protein
MKLPATPWFDGSAALTRAWPPPSGAALAAAMRDVRARDRHEVLELVQLHQLPR